MQDLPELPFLIWKAEVNDAASGKAQVCRIVLLIADCYSHKHFGLVPISYQNPIRPARF